MRDIMIMANKKCQTVSISLYWNLRLQAILFIRCWIILSTENLLVRFFFISFSRLNRELNSTVYYCSIASKMLLITKMWQPYGTFKSTTTKWLWLMRSRPQTLTNIVFNGDFEFGAKPFRLISHRTDTSHIHNSFVLGWSLSIFRIHFVLIVEQIHIVQIICTKYETIEFFQFLNHQKLCFSV